MKFEYQPEEKKIDVVEELELNSLMMSRTQGEGGLGAGLGVRTLAFCHNHKLYNYNCCTK